MGKGRIVKHASEFMSKDDLIRFAFRIMGIDGGPGSGNFGHKGRPGKVGGSGPGGGKQYRGGRADIGYFSSRKDWLNGLSGEEQQTASRKVKRAEKMYKEDLEKRKKIENLYNRGFLTEQERRERIENEGLDNIKEGMTPEEFIMREYGTTGRRELLDLVGKARSWDQTALKLQRENLTNEEQKYLSSLAWEVSQSNGGEGLTDKQFMFNNLDSVYDKMTGEQQEFYLDMKAKACGLPTSGKELNSYSREFLEQIGAAEPLRPKKIPETDKDNKEWIKSLDPKSDEYDWVRRTAEGCFGTSLYNFGGLPNMNEVEQNGFQKIKDGIDNNDAGQAIENMMYYLTEKDKLLNGDFFKKLANTSEIDPVGVGRLDGLHAFPMRKLLTQISSESPNPVDIDKAGDVLETNFLMDKSVPQQAKADYLTLKAAALGTPVSTMDVRVSGSSLNSYVSQRRVEQGKKKRAAEYNELRKKNVVVIKGDSFSEKINSMRNESGTYTEDEIKNVGREVTAELTKAIEESKKKKEGIRSKIDELQAKRDADERIKRKDGESLRDFYERTKPIQEEYLEKRIELERQIEKEHPVVNVIARVRKIGPENPEDMKSHMPGRSTVKGDIEKAYGDYPRDWVKRSIQSGTILTKKAGRGYYSPGEIAIDGNIDEEKYSTATHELGHRFEDVVPGIAEAEATFYDRRTAGEKEESLRKLTGRNYRSDEVTKKDKFIHPYIGKFYNRPGDYEIVSMGFQYAMHEPEKLLKDPDYAEFILGLLAVG